MTVTEAGVRLIPSPLGVCLGSVGVGLVMRRYGRYYVLNMASEGILLLSLALVSTLTLTTPLWRPFIYLFISDVRYSGMLTTMLLAVIAGVDHKEQALFSSASYAFRSTDSTIDITIASDVFQNVLSMQLWDQLDDQEGADEIIPRVRDSLERHQALFQIAWPLNVSQN